MPVSISRLRRWFAAALIFVCIVVAGTYFILRHRVENALKEVPGKIGIQIQQSAAGFTISKSEQGRTLFKVQASKAVQFRQGHAELHDVTITVYGRDSSRFDQVYGKEFQYDQQTGDITSQGEVSIDLQSNPQGILNPDQALPKELKNPLHLRTTNLVFNQKTGDGWTAELVEFSVPQANGSAVGARYTAQTGMLKLMSQVRILFHGSTPSTILAQEAVLEKNPREIALQHPHAESPRQQAQADEATLYLRDDNTLDHATANGNVRMESRDTGQTAASFSNASAQKLEITMRERNRVDHAVLSGAVHFSSGNAGEGTAGRVLLDFGPKNTLNKAHGEEQVKLVQKQSSSTKTAQDVEVSAPAMDFFVANGRRLTHAETIGPPQISLQPSDGKQGPTRITADKFAARFDSLGQLSQVHGEANARVVTTALSSANAPQLDRVSTSDKIDAHFRPGTGIETLVQDGHFTYTSGTQKAFAQNARYTPADQIAILSGSPRILDTGMETTARSVRLNRATGEAFAEDDVKTTYSDLKLQPNGALLASSDPIHVTAESMTARNNPNTAIFTGNARLWQNANLVEAPTLEFQKDQRTVIANANSNQKVSTVLVGTDKRGKATPVGVTGSHLVYHDSERKAHYDGGVEVHSADLTVTSQQMDVFLAAVSAAPKSQTGSPAKLDKIIATGNVVITEPNRRGTGDKLTYTAADDKFVLTGGPPSIFDAEHGKITGVSLTLYRRSDRVVVEGDSSSPAVTQTQVVR
jgi:lipopolysaccharide export system protein LptA